MIAANRPRLTPAAISGRYRSRSAAQSTSRPWKAANRWSIVVQNASKISSLRSVGRPGPQVASIAASQSPGAATAG